MAKHCVVRLDNMSGTTDGTLLRSVRFNNGSADADIDNGMIVKLDSLLPNERELWKALTPEAATPIEEVALVATPEVMADERLRNLTDFYNTAGSNARDIFSVTTDAIDGTATVGHFVELQANTKLKDVESATGGSTIVGKVIQLEIVGSLNYAVIEVRPGKGAAG